MSEKQDRIAPRTATDLERKYNFGQTFADMLGLIDDSREKVDSVESELRDVKGTTTELRRTTEDITATVDTVSQKVELKLDADGLGVEINNLLTSGVDQVTINTAGYKFGVDGLNISDGGVIDNTLNATGMYVKSGEDEILTADVEGVNATNLHAKTYLMIGEDNGLCRFERYETAEKRIGCFWLGE